MKQPQRSDSQCSLVPEDSSEHERKIQSKLAMMSLKVLIAVNEEIAAEAAAKNLQPHVPSRQANVARRKKFSFPNLGYCVPDGWEKVQTWFVDKTGHGYEWEPALTHEQLRGALESYIEANPDHGYAIVEEGEFQVVIGAFQRKPVTNAA